MNKVSALKSDNTSIDFKTNVSHTVTSDGVTSPQMVELGKEVVVSFELSSKTGDFYVDSCTAKGFDNELVLAEV